MNLIGLLFVLVVIGVCLELVKTKIPMDDTIRVLIQVIVVLAAVWCLLALVGLVAGPSFLIPIKTSRL